MSSIKANVIELIARIDIVRENFDQLAIDIFGQNISKDRDDEIAIKPLLVKLINPVTNIDNHLLKVKVLTDKIIQSLAESIVGEEENENQKEEKTE